MRQHHISSAAPSGAPRPAPVPLIPVHLEAMSDAAVEEVDPGMSEGIALIVSAAGDVGEGVPSPPALAHVIHGDGREQGRAGYRCSPHDDEDGIVEVTV